MESQIARNEENNKLIWILEDDFGSQFVYREILGPKYHVEFFSHIKDFKHILDKNEHSPHLVIADIRLADDSFLNFMLSYGKSLPFKFIVVSSMDDLDALRHCFRLGALDYITKPFGKSEMIVKVENIINATTEAVPLPQTEEKEGVDFTVDPKTFFVKRGEIRSSPLTTKEFQIFTTLEEAKGQALSRTAIMERIWPTTNVSLKTLDVHLVNLRKKIAPLGLCITHIPPSEYYLHYGMNH